ncbi:hypothetical protein ES703_90071 [subsurface metagenome]
MSIRFKLRLDMPTGFKKNEQYPELPAILNYLIPYDKQEFTSPEEFHKQVLSGTMDYLEKQEIPVGGDPKLREGLDIEELKERFQTPDGGWDYIIFTLATNEPGRCVFGGLERVS